jgi:hypothetical protein
MNEVWTSAAVKLLFTNSDSGRLRAPEREYQRFADLVNTKQVLYERMQYTIPTPQPEQQAFYRLAFLGSNASVEHGRVKWAAWCWARSLGEPQPGYEVRLSHGVADVVAPTLKYLIECGDTTPQKVTEVLTSGWKVFALFTYPYVEFTAWSAAGRPEDSELFLVNEAVLFRFNPEIPFQEPDIFQDAPAGRLGL